MAFVNCCLFNGENLPPLILVNCPDVGGLPQHIAAVL